MFEACFNFSWVTSVLQYFWVWSIPPWGILIKTMSLLPINITSSFYCVHKGLGIPSVLNELDIEWALQVWKNLTSADPKIDVCQTTEGQCDSQKSSEDASFKVILDFLNSHPDEGEHHKSSNVRSSFGLVWGRFHCLHNCCVMWRETRLTLCCR